MTRLKTAEVTAGLQRWTSTHDAHVRAAVDLLIDHGHWLRDTTFLDEAVTKDSDGDVWINWRNAREALTSGKFSTASSTERAVLDLAIAIGSDQYRLSRMDGDRGAGALVVRAMHTALGAAI